MGFPGDCSHTANEKQEDCRLAASQIDDVSVATTCESFIPSFPFLRVLVSFKDVQEQTREIMKKLRFLVSLHTRENDFQVAQGQSAEHTARKLGSDVEIIFADNDSVNQSTQLLKAIQGRVESRPDAIVVEPVGSTAMPQVARAACAAGIGWAVLNKRPDYLSDFRSTATAPIFAVSSDHFEIGRIQGRQFAALLPGGGSVLYIKGPSQSRAAQERELGMLETKPSNIQLAMLKAEWTEKSAGRSVRSWLKLATSQSSPI